jgi:hypothetical protein
LFGILDDGQSPDIKLYNTLKNKFSNEAEAFQLTQNELHYRAKFHQKSSHDNYTGLYMIQNIHKRSK